MLEQSLETCLERIREREDAIHAWVEVAPQAPLGEGPLSGVAFGAKDIFETLGLATEYGSPLYQGRRGDCDAALVTALRKLGGVLVGKTHTTAFAYFDPAPTRNPRDLRRTPGGSSSGSAAAVAAGMVPLALGTQTQGSILRPASFCGVVGFKPTYGLLPIGGVLPFAPSLDTAGCFTATAADMRVVWRALFPQPAAPAARRLAYFVPPCDEPMRRAVHDAVARLRANGVPVEALDPPPVLDELLAAVRTINGYEGARTHERRWREHGERIGVQLAALVCGGLAIPEERYRQALDFVAGQKSRFAALLGESVWLTPAAPGAAPLGLDSTGDPRLNAPWTGLGVPAISIPMPADPPLGLQALGAWNEDDRLLATAEMLESCLWSR